MILRRCKITYKRGYWGVFIVCSTWNILNGSERWGW